MKTYQCDECSRTFESEWSDEEATAEAKANFGNLPQEQMAIVCEDCFQSIMHAKHGRPFAGQR